MSGSSVENTVLILDISRSMRRTDFPPTRLQTALKAAKIFLDEKVKIDKNDAYGLITVGASIQIHSKISKNTQEIINLLSEKEFLKKFSPSGNQTLFSQAIKNAIDMLSEQIRLIGGQVNRILIITDCHHLEFSEEIKELIKIADGLNIHIDICLFHVEKTKISRDNYIRITQMTHGEFGEFFNPKSLFRAMIGFASKKIIEDEPFKLLSPQEKEDSKYLNDIALDLRKPTEQEFQIMTSAESKIQCQICFNKKAPHHNYSLTKIGRYCPFCKTPMHLHCAGLWALKAEAAPGLFRCPFCYTLLRMPMWILKGLETQKLIQTGKIKNHVIKMIRVKEEDLDKNLNYEFLECQYCFKPITKDMLSFNPDTEKNPTSVNEKPESSSIARSSVKEKIFRCSHCNAFYHLSCLAPMYKEDPICFNCHGKII